jgi:hypothetical protein
MFFAMSGLAKFSAGQANVQHMSTRHVRAIHPFFAHKFNVEYGTPVIRVTWRAVNPICMIFNGSTIDAK